MKNTSLIVVLAFMSALFVQAWSEPALSPTAGDAPGALHRGENFQAKQLLTPAQRNPRTNALSVPDLFLRALDGMSVRTLHSSRDPQSVRPWGRAMPRLSVEIARVVAPSTSLQSRQKAYVACPWGTKVIGCAGARQNFTQVPAPSDCGSENDCGYIGVIPVKEVPANDPNRIACPGSNTGWCARTTTDATGCLAGYATDASGSNGSAVAVATCLTIEQ